MIKFIDQVPSIYSSASRDFQYLGWLIDIVLNSVKYNVDGLYYLPNTKDFRLTELLALTFGFKVKRNYDQRQLIALVSILPTLLKYKGTKKAVTIALDALIKASGAYGDFNANSCDIENNMLEVTIPKGLVDTTLFTDLLPYILPAGMTCRIIRKALIDEQPTTEVAYSDALYAEWYDELDWDDDKQVSIGITEMFNTGNNPEFMNYTKASKETGKLVLNSGLLDNTIIPTLDTERKIPLTDDKSNLKGEETTK